jgi:hypothetical protein
MVLHWRSDSTCGTKINASGRAADDSDVEDSDDYMNSSGDEDEGRSSGKESFISANQQSQPVSFDVDTFMQVRQCAS